MADAMDTEDTLLTLTADIVAAQIEAVVSDIGTDAVKTGMLATAARARRSGRSAPRPRR